MLTQNISREIKIEKVVLNCGATSEKLEKSIKLLELVSGAKPIKTLSKKRIPAFAIRPGLPVGCIVTIRGKKVVELLKRFFAAINNQLNSKQVGNGTVCFGVHEYIEIPGMQFQRDIGIMGFDVAVDLERAGFSITRRKRMRSKIPLRHKISKEETIKFMQENFNIKIIQKRGEEK